MKVLLLNENLFLCANMKILNAVITHKDFYWNDLPKKKKKKLLGHKKIDTTMHYAMVNQNNVKISHRKYIG